MVHDVEFVFVKKSGNKLYLTLKKGVKIPDEWYNSDDFMWNDLSFEISGLDGWSYIIDTNQMKVFPFNEYHWDALDELRKKGKVVLTALTRSDAKDYIKEFMGD
jgi:hypothetical protein